MKFNFPDLNEDLRVLMLNEVLHDISKKVLHYSPKFNANGRKVYLTALKEAISSGDEETLQAALEVGDNFNMYEGYGKKVSPNTAMLFAKSEFNRYYIRAICVKAIENGYDNVEIFRAQEVKTKSVKADQRIGRLLNADKLLKDMRTTVGGVSTVFPEQSSGLSVKFPEPKVVEPFNDNTVSLESEK